MRGLILVDLQNDFLPGGALAVSRGDEVVRVANRLIALKGKAFSLVLATQDFHPAGHGSFASNNNAEVGSMGKLAGLDQIMWPDHCVQGTPGADFAGGLDIKKADRIFQKGTDPQIDSYSGFFDNGHRKSTGLGEFLKESGTKELVILGLATDYCVKFTVFDALQLGFSVTLVSDGVRGVNLQPQDSVEAISEMKAAGAIVMNSDDLIQKLGV